MSDAWERARNAWKDWTAEEIAEELREWPTPLGMFRAMGVLWPEFADELNNIATAIETARELEALGHTWTAHIARWAARRLLRDLRRRVESKQ